MRKSLHAIALSLAIYNIIAPDVNAQEGLVPAAEAAKQIQQHLGTLQARKGK